MSNLTPLDTAQSIHNGPQTAPARMHEETAISRLYQFGSDNHFSQQGFQPPIDTEPHESVASRLTEELLMMKPINRSNAPTRTSSPTFRAAHALMHTKKRSSGHLDLTHQDLSSSEDYDTRPRKRRKDSEEDSKPYPTPKRKFASLPNANPNSQPRTRRISSVAEPSGSMKRRRSSLTGSAKAANRENLTEDQKRSNHIQSEQKRRNLIKNGFDELRRLVPELRGGGLSKSMELTEVSNFLDQVIAANEAMRERMGIPKPG